MYNIETIYVYIYIYVHIHIHILIRALETDYVFRPLCYIDPLYPNLGKYGVRV